MVQKAVSRSGYYAQEEWEKLPPQVRATVTPQILHEWSQAEDYDPGVAAGQYHRYYVAAQERRTDQLLIPGKVRDDLAAAMTLAKGTEQEKPRLSNPSDRPPELLWRERVNRKYTATLAELLEQKKRELKERAAGE